MVGGARPSVYLLCHKELGELLSESRVGHHWDSLLPSPSPSPAGLPSPSLPKKQLLHGQWAGGLGIGERINGL